MQVSQRSGDGRAERRVLAAMIGSNRALGMIASRWDGEMFASSISNQLGRICVEHYNKFGKAPKDDLYRLVQAWAESANRTSEQVEEMGQFVASIELGRVNPGLAVDQAARHFQSVRVRREAERAIAHLTAGRPDKAVEALEKFRRIDMGEDDEVNVLTDKEAWREALEYHADPPLVRYEGALGEMFGSSLARGCLVAFMAPTAVGKSWFLMDLAYRACLERKRTLFFSIGDMTRPQAMGRFIARACERPLYPCADVRWPRSMTVDEQGVDVQFEHRSCEGRVSLRDAEEAFGSVVRNKVKSVGKYLAMRNLPANTVTVAKLKAACERAAANGDPPDLLVVDYADLLVPTTNQREMRDRINSVWEELRGLSQTQHLLLATATQGNRASISANFMRMEHTSEEIRKNHWATAMFGISCHEDERPLGVRRLNCFKMRGEGFSPHRVCYVAGCLPAGNPAILSEWRKRKTKGE